MISRGGRVTSKYYFNVKGKDGLADGMYLDRVEWKKDKMDVQEELDIKEVQVVMIPAKEQGSPECWPPRRRRWTPSRSLTCKRRWRTKDRSSCLGTGS